MRASNTSLVLVTSLCLTVAGISCDRSSDAGEWAQWMGPHGDGSAGASGLFRRSGEIELRELWRRAGGKGYSSISVVGGTAYTLAAVGGFDALLAIDARSGTERWRLDLELTANGEPLATPAVDASRVFAVTATGKLYAVDTDDGTTLWTRDLRETLGAELPTYGMSTSPLVADGMLVVLVGGSAEHNLAAFDPGTGELIWSVFHAGLGSFSTPVVGTLAGTRQIVVPAGDRLYAVRPSDGSLLWALDGIGYPDRNPLLIGDRILLPLESVGVMLRIQRDGGTLRPREIWRSASLRDSYSPAVHLNGSIYGFEASKLTCLDAKTGETRWSHSLGAGSLILVDEHLIIQSTDDGRLRVVAADPERFNERAFFDVFDAHGSFTPPSFAGRTIFVRNDEEIVAVEVVD